MKELIIQRLLFFILNAILAFYFSLTSAQEKNYYFRHLTTREGLSTNVASCINQDIHGFIWIGTREGLYKFDGSYLQSIIPSDKNPAFNRNSAIDYIYCDPSGDIWITSYAGLYCYNSISDSLKWFYPVTGKKGDLMEQPVHFVYPTNQNRFLLIHNGGLLSLFAPRSGEVTFFSNDSLRADATYFSAAHMNNFIVLHDSRDELFYLPSSSPIFKLKGDNFIQIPSTMSAGILAASIDSKDNLYFSDEKSVQVFNTRDTLSKIRKIEIPTKGQRILSLKTDDRDNLWVSLDGFIIGYNPELKEVFFTSGNTSEKGLQLTPSRSIYPVRSGAWFLRGNHVLSYYSYEDNKMIHLKHDPTDPNSPLETYNFKTVGKNLGFFESKNGVCFILGESGVSYVDLGNAKFPVIKSGSNSPGSINGSKIRGIAAEGEDFIWIGTEKGLDLYDRKLNLSYTHTPFDDLINNILVTREGSEIWVASTMLSVHQFNKYTKSLKQVHSFLPDPNDSTSLPGWFVTRIIKDSKNDIWVCTGDGLGKYMPHPDGKSFGTFRQYKPIPGNPESLQHKIVWDIFEASDGTYWICTMGGLSRLNPSTNTFTNYYSDGKPGSIATNNVKAVAEDKNKRIWIGTEGNGLCMFDATSNSFLTYTMKDGMPSNSVYGIKSDDDGYLWLSTSKGISKFDPITTEFINFTVADGLPNDQFNIQSYGYNSSTGEILFGSNKGIVIFDPGLIGKSDFQPALYITDFRLFNKTVPTGKWKRNRVILSKAIWETEQITLKHDENNLEFGFSALDYSSPEQIIYEFILEGFQEEWQRTSNNQSFSSYTNVPPGRYIFRVRSTNGDGYWANNEKALHIRVLSPWWERWWFKTFSIITIIGLSMLIYFRRLNSLKKQKQLLEERVERRTKSLKEANEKLEIQKNEIILQKEKLIEVEEQKLRFFTSISHELKTPLTVIAGVSEKYLTSSQNRQMKSGDIEMIHRNTSHLLELINQLLDIRRIDRHSFNLKVRQINPAEYFTKISKPYHQLASLCKLHFSLHIDKALDLCWLDPSITEKITSNLISNAIKFTPDGGNIALTISSTGTALVLEVKDTGRGIPSDQISSIFDRFYQDELSGFRRFESSGIGLSLVEELVRLHHGTIAVQSELNKGSNFSVSLPVSLDSYSPAELIPDSADIQEFTFSRSNISRIRHQEITTIPEDAESSISRNNLPLVLVVEDNTDLRTFLTGLLNERYQVLTAGNGKMGLELAISTVPDIIITDLMMPVMDGIKMTQQIKQNIGTCHIPVIQLTARGADEYQVEGLQSGADDYITKPFNAEALFLKIQNILQTRHKLQLKLSNFYQPGQSPVVASNPDETFIKTLIEIITAYITDPALDGEFIAHKLTMGKTTLYRKLQALTGTTVNLFIRDIRLKKAVELLNTRQHNISEAGFMVGFNNHSYFTKCFTEKYGISPTDYMKSGTL